MKNNELQNKVITAAKWSSVTEVAVKLVSPITNIILARVIAPEEFGVIATVIMIVSFIEMFTEGGFQKYLIQKDFKDKEEAYNTANVAFWTNALISLFFWLMIILFQDQIAIIVGNPGLGNVIAVSGVQLLLTSFSSIQLAIYKRAFNYRTLFFVRMISSVIIPVLVTVPLAFFGFGYWSIIIANILNQVISALILTIKSEWKPKLFYDFSILVDMFSTSIWMLIESISVWSTNWTDIFIISNVLDIYYIGIYKTAIATVNGLMSIITGSTTSVLYSTLSRLKTDKENFISTFIKFQRLVSIIVIPMGVGVFLYRDLATRVMLGDQWKEASDVLGIWALVSSLTIVLGHYNSELYRALGRPKLSILAQVLNLVILIPSLLISSKRGFMFIVLTRSIVKLLIIPIHFVIMKLAIKFPVRKIVVSVFPSLFAALIMSIVGSYLQTISEYLLWDIFSIIMCVVVYVLLICIFPSIRKELLTLRKSMMSNR